MYNEADRIEDTLRDAFNFVVHEEIDAEFILINDGSTDNTVNTVYTFIVDHPEIPTRVINRTENQGKGSTVAEGVALATHEYCVIMDADNAASLWELTRFVSFFTSEKDILIGSRYAESRDERDVIQPYKRELLGKMFNALVRSWFLPEIYDTQCGFKCVETVLAKQLFKQLTVRRWAFDVELLLIARMMGAEVVEVPISWKHMSGSSVSFTRSAPSMLLDLLYLLRRKRDLARMR